MYYTVFFPIPITYYYAASIGIERGKNKTCFQIWLLAIERPATLTRHKLMSAHRDELLRSFV